MQLEEKRTRNRLAPGIIQPAADKKQKVQTTFKILGKKTQVIPIGEWSRNSCKHLHTYQTRPDQNGQIIDTCMTCGATRTAPGTRYMIQLAVDAGLIRFRPLHRGESFNNMAREVQLSPKMANRKRGK